MLCAGPIAGCSAVLRMHGRLYHDYQSLVSAFVLCCKRRRFKNKTKKQRKETETKTKVLARGPWSILKNKLPVGTTS